MYGFYQKIRKFKNIYTYSLQIKQYMIYCMYTISVRKEKSMKNINKGKEMTDEEIKKAYINSFGEEKWKEEEMLGN